MKNGGYDEARRLVGALSLDEKIALLSGKDYWTTKSFNGIPSITMTDGPHGVRLAKEGTSFSGVPATCYPTASALASTWDVALAQKVGDAIGLEAQAMDVQVVLGPGVNMKRSPLGGRNFEYFSEDPYLTAQMAIAMINGMQSQGVGTSLKHFAANNQEFERMNNSSDIDERTLHEIYLRAFELTVKASQPWSLMSSYNLINGTRAVSSPWLLQDLLRDTWGHEGIIVSDWMAAAIDRPLSIAAGTHLEMPGGSLDSTKDVHQAVAQGALSEATITERAIQLVANILKVARTKRPNVTYDQTEHHLLARRAASEAIVLLKNDKKLLPLTPGTVKKILIIGAFAKKPRYQGGGSSQMTPTQLDTLLESMQNLYGAKAEVSYAQGYRLDGTTTPGLLEKAVAAAKKAEVVVFAAALPTAWEFEGVDRPTINLPDGINQVIEAVADVHQKVVVTLANGSAVALPWLDKVDAVVEGWLAGQASASAMAAVVAGLVNPSGKLSETFPYRIEDTSAYPEFPNKTGHARYTEGIFIGYRWFDTRKIAPQFPFGYGLSYTTFEYGKLHISKASVYDDQSFNVNIEVKNTGKIAGKEVVQLYISNHETVEVHPAKELKKFTKILLEPGETQTVTFELSAEDLAFYSELRHGWATTPGRYTISVGRSSAQIESQAEIEIIARHPEVQHITPTSRLKDLAAHPRGKRVYSLLASQMAKAMAGEGSGEAGMSQEALENTLMELIGDMPIDRLPAASNGLMTRDFITGIVTYCHHATGWHPIESFAYYKEVAKLIGRAATQQKKK